MIKIGDKIKEIRLKENLTQEQFAEKIFVSREAVSKWEQGRGIPDIENLKAISRTFKVSVDNLLDNEDITQLAINNKNEICKMKRIQIVSSSVIAVCLVVFIIVGLINIPRPAPVPSGELRMPEGVLIGFYIDTKGDGNIDIKSVIDNNAPSNDVYLISIPNTPRTYVHQGIHNFTDVKHGDYSNYQCDIFFSKDIIEISKYYSVYYNYAYSDYQKAHGYSLVEITTEPTFYGTNQTGQAFLHQYSYKYLTYGSETLSDRVVNTTFYFNVFAVENFNKMKITEYDEQYNELITAEVKNGDTYTIKPETYRLKLYYTADNSVWYVSNYGTFMFGGTEPYDVEVVTQIINKDGYVGENPENTFKIVRD